MSVRSAGRAPAVPRGTCDCGHPAGGRQARAEAALAPPHSGSRSGDDLREVSRARTASDVTARATELAEDLERWLEGRPIVARPVSAPTQAWRWSKRNPMLASAPRRLPDCRRDRGHTTNRELALATGNPRAARRPSFDQAHSVARPRYRPASRRMEQSIRDRVARADEGHRASECQPRRQLAHAPHPAASVTACRRCSRARHSFGNDSHTQR